MNTNSISKNPTVNLRIIARDQHCISRKNISSSALRVLYRLHEAGYAAYLVGGAVRDLLLGGHPKDFDIATNATPEQIKALFRNCRLIGRRFRLAHVMFGSEIVEVATFRGSGDDGSGDRHIINGRIVRDNIYGTLEEDALRRDFTVNALYYDIADFSVRDYVGGYDDLHQRTLRLIGDPILRYREDPVRMLRAVRLAAKLDFMIEPTAEEPFVTLGSLLEEAPPARLFDESLKMFLGGYGQRCFQRLYDSGILGPILPLTAHSLAQASGEVQRCLIQRGLENTDQRIAEGKSVTPAFLFAALLWGAVSDRAERAISKGVEITLAWQRASNDVLYEQTQHISIPRRFSGTIQEIWALQSRFEQRSRKSVFRLLAHPRFRAAYDFLLLRGAESPALEELGQWWTVAQTLSHQELADRLSDVTSAAKLSSTTKKKRSRRRRGRASSAPAPIATTSEPEVD